MCSSSRGQLYEYNLWYNHSVLVAVQYTGRPLTVRNMQRIQINISQKKLCIKLFTYRNYTKMHGQENIKKSRNYIAYVWILRGFWPIKSAEIEDLLSFFFCNWSIFMNTGVRRLTSIPTSFLKPQHSALEITLHCHLCVILQTTLRNSNFRRRQRSWSGS